MGVSLTTNRMSQNDERNEQENVNANSEGSLSAIFNRAITFLNDNKEELAPVFTFTVPVVLVFGVLIFTEKMLGRADRIRQVERVEEVPIGILEFFASQSLAHQTPNL